MGVPIYLFTGFLESGKTSLIKETLLDPGFGQEEKTLILACEEGMEEYDDAFLKQTNSVVVYIEDIKDLEYKNLKKLDATIEPDRVMIEFNGVWKLSEYLEILETLPEEARIVSYRVKGSREYLSGVLMPEPGSDHKYGLYGIHLP